MLKEYKKISVLLLIFVLMLPVYPACPSEASFCAKVKENNWDILAGNQNILCKLYLNGRFTPISSELGYVFSISPDGQKIVYRESIQSSGTFLTISNLDGSQKERLFKSDQEKWVQNAIWSPVNNNEIAYLGDYNYERATCSLYIFNIKEKSSHLVVKDSVNALSPLVFSWSPDGKRITFTDAAGHIMVVDKNGSHLTQITEDFGDVPSWSPDGKKIAYRQGKRWRKFYKNGHESQEGRTGDGKYYVLNLETKNRKEIFNNKAFWIYPLGIASQPVWSPDSRYVLLNKWIGGDITPLHAEYWCIDIKKRRGRIIHNFKSKLTPNSNIFWRKTRNDK
ncbi:MAG: PD40 domain-containing protein [Candidatus Omnitrophota bacterium]|nr:MAG: PD40 domain-containing protein [Candidatus Omnitrophota bacterium]